MFGVGQLLNGLGYYENISKKSFREKVIKNRTANNTWRELAWNLIWVQRIDYRMKNTSVYFKVDFPRALMRKTNIVWISSIVQRCCYWFRSAKMRCLSWIIGMICLYLVQVVRMSRRKMLGLLISCSPMTETNLIVRGLEGKDILAVACRSTNSPTRKTEHLFDSRVLW
jgi:hypothetical protein